MKTSLLYVVMLVPSLTIASGPLFIEGPNDTMPVKYQNPTIGLNFDLDLLAGTDALVIDAFNLWNSATTSNVSLTKGANLNVNVNVTNYNSYIPTTNNTTPATDGLNPVIYDTDGSIIDDFFGANQSDDIAGFSVSSFRVRELYYTEGYAVINGKNLGLTNTQITLVVAHEIGHFIGLDHTLADIEEDLVIDMNGFLATACTTKSQNRYPLMYPIVCRRNNSLHQDDVISVSTLYPSTDINQQLGQITGKFVQINGGAILGANIWVKNTATNDVYSVVSDYLTTGNGFFSSYLPAGSYTLHANSIDPTFNGASGVGPYAEDPVNSASFKTPHPIIPISYEGNTPGSDEILTITIGKATNVNFKLDGSGVATTDNKIFTPTFKKPSNDDGGGAIAPAYFMMLIFIVYLRILNFSRKH